MSGLHLSLTRTDFNFSNDTVNNLSSTHLLQLFGDEIGCNEVKPLDWS